MTPAVVRMPADTPMTAFNYTLPPPIYLPSSGGYTGSRFTEDPIHRRVFPFRKYSVDEDGRLVFRTKSTNYEPRPKPYDRPQRHSAVSPGPECKQIDPSVFSQLFQQLMPIAVNEPLSFESKAPMICASFNLDPAMSADIISSIKEQFPAIRNSETAVLPPPGGPANNSVVPLSLQGTTLNPPATVPVKQRRQFSCGSSAYTTWYSTASAQDLASPPQQVVPAVGELYIHHNRLEDKHQIWLYGLDSVWKCVTGVEKVYHPTIDDRVLSVRANGTPNWITAASYTTIRGRRCKKTQAE